MDSLARGKEFQVGQSLMSANGRYTLVLQEDGNLVLYEGAQAHWSTGTWQLPLMSRPTRAAMQEDGNFVLYSALGQPAWASGTDGKGGDRLSLQDDRNLVIYRPDNVAVWDSGTWVRPDPHSGGTPITKHQKNDVGWGKSIESHATLYRDGQLFVSAATKNDNWSDGLWGRILVTVVDSQGRTIWVSRVLSCTTRCSVPDFSCASYGTDTLQEKFPDIVGQLAEHIDIYQASRANFVDLRTAFVNAVKSAGEVVAVLGPVLALL